MAEGGADFSATLQMISGLLKGLSSIGEGFQKQRAFAAKADMQRDQARRETLVAKREALDFRRRQSRLQSARRVGIAARGGAASGSALLGSQALAGEIELGALDILNAGEARATYLRNSAAVSDFAGQSALIGGAASGGSTLLTAGLDYAESFYTGDEEPLDAGLPQFDFGSARRERLPGRV